MEKNAHVHSFCCNPTDLGQVTGRGLFKAGMMHDLVQGKFPIRKQPRAFCDEKRPSALDLSFPDRDFQRETPISVSAPAFPSPFSSRAGDEGVRLHHHLQEAVAVPRPVAQLVPGRLQDGGVGLQLRTGAQAHKCIKEFCLVSKTKSPFKTKLYELQKGNSLEIRKEKTCSNEASTSPVPVSGAVQLGE